MYQPRYYLILRNLAIGLCETCQHVRRITSDRGSVFYLCQLSGLDQRFPKYPRLPVLQCEGYQENIPNRDDSGTSTFPRST